jgi:GntR family transcriptional regulator, transcriptional repressor for pyruvate dehydrogenase complex
LPIKRRKLSDSVIEEIGRMLKNGEFKIGDKLPPHSQLARMLQVSRITLREAMHTLNLLGVLDQRPGYGTVIKSTFPKGYSAVIKLPIFSGNSTVEEFLDAREIIELGAVTLISKNINSDEINRMAALVEKMQETYKTADDYNFSKVDTEFHKILINSARNRFLNQIFETIKSFTEQFMVEGYTIVPSLREEAVRDHRSILSAMKTKNVQLIRRKISQHAQLRRRIFKSILQK